IEEDIPQQNQLTIYRIVQELLSNAIKHSQASMILVQCSQNQNRLFITVEDNGKGFNLETNSFHSGMGLDNIRNRVSYLDGQLEIKSVPNEGTIINIELDVYK
ncbi:MAG: ATP-binding protein, partial [Bacteroidota bacterium]|nr:ATP-binding protein [Bacteroidota bacterium]